MITKGKERLIDRMIELYQLIDETIEAIGHLPDNADGHLYQTLNPGKLQIRMDYKPQEYIQVRRGLSKHWGYKRHEFNNLTGNFYVYFRHRKTLVELSLELDIPTEYQPGTSCKLVEIGHTTQVIYGLECKE